MALSESTPTYPLTTIFTPPASCSASWTYEAPLYNSVTGGLLIQNALANGIDDSCFPPKYADNGRGQASEVYSPGYCPSGYTSPAVFSGNGVTTGVCCQSGFTYYTTLTTINFFSSTTIFAGCLSIYPKSSGATTVRARANDTDLTTTAISGPISMWGQPVVVEFQQKDLTLFSTSTSSSSSTSSTSSGTASPSPTTGQPAVTSTGAPTPSTNPKSGLSTGAEAGIGVGVALVALILLAIAAFFIRRKRNAGQNPNHGSEHKVELPATHESRPGELHGDQLFQYDHYAQNKRSTRQGPVSELA